jgi:hypothetical protein
VSQRKYQIPVQRPPAASDDEKAESEEAAFAFGLDPSSAETARQIDRIKQKQNTDNFLQKLLRCFLLVAFLVLTAAFVILFYHYLAPESLLFLSEARVQNLKDLLLSGSVGAALAQLWRSKLLET